MSRKRYGAFEIKTDAIFKIAMQIMPHRYDATNITFININCEKLDEFVAEQFHKEGKTYTYMDVVMAAAVRTLAKNHRLNRYVINGRLYENYKITPCFTIKTKLTDDSEEAQLKYDFNGNETISEIQRILGEQIVTYKNVENETGTTEMANMLHNLPMFFTRMGVGFFKRCDKRNRFTKLINEVSPFHCSFALTNLKSLKIEAIAHHCYDFGSTSIFLSMGKEKFVPVVNDNGDIVKAKVMPMGISIDERICDGFAFAKGIRTLKELIENPKELVMEYHDEKVDGEIAKDEQKRAEAETKAQKKAKKK